MVSQQFTCCICSTKARAPNEGPERQQVINKRPERLPKDQSVNKLSTKARAPNEEPERQEVINKRPERLPKDQSVKKLSTKT